MEYKLEHKLPDTSKELWYKVFKENYEGVSPEAQDLKRFLKDTYKGDAYIPWAPLERLMYMQDPDAILEVIRDEETGALVHTDMLTNKIVDEETEVSKGVESRKTRKVETLMMSHMIVVRLTFLGVTRYEYYPLQTKAYDAAKIFDQNIVNKAIQRAKAKVIARTTGLALSLYEGLDLQFEDDGAVELKVEKVAPGDAVKSTKTGKKLIKADTPEVTPKVTQEVPEVKEVKDEPISQVVAENKVVETKEFNSESLAFAKEILGDERFDVGLKFMNGAIQKSQNFTITRTETPEQLAGLLSTIKSLPMFMTTLRKRSGISA